MENENNNMNQDSGSTYHFGRNESPFGREDISGNSTSDMGNSNPAGDTAHKQQETSGQQTDTQNRYSSQSGNPYSQGNVYGQGIYTGNDFANANQTDKKEKRKKDKKAKKSSSGKAKKAGLLIASAAVFGLVAGGVMVGVNAVGNKLLGKNDKNTEIATVTTTDAGIKKVSEDGVADVVEEVMPSIVSITNTSVQTVRSWFQSYEQEVSGSGSGIIIGQTDDEILIATNNHVIEGAKEITVAFSDETAVEATVKGADSSADLAVLVVNTENMEKDTLSKIKVAALGSSDDLRVGESAIAIGNALGYGQSVTVGFISAIDREVDVEDTSMTLLQTDAAINPGNSGGALLNAKGEVIGINTVKYVDSTVEGMGYAIPISKAIPIINDLMNQEVIEESEQGYLGIQGNDITDEYAKNFNMPNGVYVVKIVEDSPADKCGLKAGDIITQFGGRDVNSMETLQNILSNKKAGEEIEMIVQRNNEKGEYKEITLKVTLGAKKDMPDDDEDDSTEKQSDTEQISPEDFFDEFNEFYHN
ncbi:MAG: S1C family serine protease [Lachnospiraceae bacterium]